MERRPQDAARVFEARYQTRKQQTADLARQRQTPQEEAVIHQATTTPARATRN